MPKITSQEAANKARLMFELGDDAVARAWPVGRLDCHTSGYYLVAFDKENGSVAVATVDATSGEIQNSACLTGDRPHISIDVTKAVVLAGAKGDVNATMVWRPCEASRSPLYPLWRIQSASKTVYVDQQGVVWPELRAIGPGGGNG